MSSLAHAFTIINIVTTEQSAGLTFSQILSQSELARSTLHRQLKQLTALNVLSYDAETKMYRGGLALAKLGARVTASFDVRTNSRPALKGLHNALGYVVTLGICGDAEGVYIDKIEAQDFGLRLHSEIGKPFPLHCTAMGKVILTYSEPDLTDRVIASGLDAFTDNTITTAEKLKQALRRVREQGYAKDDEEISRGLMCLSAPIFGLQGEIIAALSFTAPKHIFKGEMSKDAINVIKHFAKQASLS